MTNRNTKRDALRERNRLACERYRARTRKKVEPIVDLPGEEWRRYPGSPDLYEVSSMGRVRSVERVVMVRQGRFDDPDKMVARRKPAKLRATHTDRAGYHCIGLERTAKASRTHHVHVMVCETFHGPRPPGMLALHWNDVRDDNRADNLRWGTPSENSQDAWRNGRFEHRQHQAYRSNSDGHAVQRRFIPTRRT